MSRAKNTKEKIERTALQLFVERGVAETSIRDVAGEAGVSQGAMYNHYKSKDELAWSLFATNFAELGMELRRLAQEQTDLPARVRAMVGFIFAHFDRDPLPITYVFFARHENLRRITSQVRNPYMVFRSVISEAMEHGEIPRQDPELSASLVIGAVTQVIDTKILGRIDRHLTELTEPVAAACLRLLQR
jgi:AcrR family transcriptional regulator